MSEATEPNARVPAKVAAIVPEVSAKVADTLVNEIPLALRLALLTLAVQLFAAR